MEVNGQWAKRDLGRGTRNARASLRKIATNTSAAGDGDDCGQFDMAIPAGQSQPQ